ncbi:hypothetical protein BH23CHL2_BH23CHL2_25700 [soil metagenome]
MVLNRFWQSIANSTRGLRGALGAKPVESSGRAGYRPFPSWIGRSPWLVRPAFWLGLAPDDAVLLEVKEWQSGSTRRTVVVQLTHDRSHYLVSAGGESDWVRDVRAADGKAVIRRRQSLPVKLVEPPVEERVPVIAAYIDWAGESDPDAGAQVARDNFGLGPDPSPGEIEAIAEHYPVFRILRKAEEQARRKAQEAREPEIRLTAQRGEMPIYLATPEGEGPWPGVVIIHDIFGMTTDLKNQADWLAGEGFLAAAPDLQYWGSQPRCLFAMVRQISAREGSIFNDLNTTRSWLAGRDDCTGKVGVIGFCMGGGYAVVLASGHGYDASSVNYGGVPADAMTLLADACPMVGSFGGKDEGLSSAPVLLEDVLMAHGIDHDVKVYPEAGHSFMNDHDPDDLPRWSMILGMRPDSEPSYHEPSALDARRRIVEFFNTHLGKDPVQGIR